MLHAFKDQKNTIVAPATTGVSAIGIIRMSGPASFYIINQLFPSKNVMHQPSHTLHVGWIIFNTKPIDEVVISLFKTPRSYTGEDVIEISCHGSPYIVESIIQACVYFGARMATPGEFTLRAFMNGKINLLQAEAVADLIASENKTQHNIAIQQMKGGFNQELQLLREKLIHFTSYIELELDFAEEDVEFANRVELKKIILEIKNKIKELSDSFQYGNVIKNGIPTVIVGRPNAGKSTLLNTLLNEERAIVSSIPGTTRDVIEEVMVLEGMHFRFIDTAGLRKADDQIEKIGIRKTFEKIDLATIIIYLYDSTQINLDELHDDLKRLSDENKIIISVANKLDLFNGINDTFETSMNEKYPHIIHLSISAKNKINVDFLKKELVVQVQKKYTNSQSIIITNARHYEALNNALNAIEQVEKGMSSNTTSDLLAVDIKKILYHIGEITGQIDINTDILGTIFSKFCIGK